jgi:DNA-binding response OmpR family regulator
MHARRQRISVVNDNPDFLELMAAILDEDAGYEVSLHHGEEMPLAELRAAHPDLIVMDLLLGQTSGWELIALARTDDALRDVPVVVCSADIAQLRDRSTELSQIAGLHILQKPFSVDELTELVERVLSEPAGR